MNEAYRLGFIKRAAEYGIAPAIAEQIVSENEKLAAMDESMETYRHRRQNIRKMLLAAGGAGIGALAGGSGINDAHAGLHALLGAGLGGGLGYGIGALKNKFEDYTGVVDPWQQRTIAPSMMGAFKQPQQ